MTAGVLTLCDICVRRAGRTILEIGALEIPCGAFVGLVGANGAGKTTLLKVCSGLIKPDRGRVRLDDVDLAGLSPWRQCHLRRRIGYIPQAAEYNAELPFTLREVVAMGRAGVRPLLSRLNGEDHAIIDDWIETLGLSAQRDQTFRSLSGGEQQKALIARAMTQNPEILMLDEPCANLDFTWKYEISEIVERLHRRTAITVLMVSHETGVLPEACTRIVLMGQGRILADGDADAVLTPETLREAYHGCFEVVLIGGRRHIVSLPAAVRAESRT